MRPFSPLTMLAGAAIAAAGVIVPVSLTASAAPTGAGFTPGLALLDDTGASPGGAEPSIAVDSHDNVYVAAPVGVPTGGCPFWWVHPGTFDPSTGRAYSYRGTIDTDHEGVGGGDCDIATQRSLGNSSYDEVSVSSLSLANLTTNKTTDAGNTWQDPANPFGMQVFGVDRQWQATDQGLGVQYLTTHDLATTNIQVATSTDGGYTYVQNTPAIDLAHQGTATGNNGNHFGTTVVDQKTHKIYIPFIAPGSPSESTNHVVYLAVGTPGATATSPISWTDYTVYSGPANQSLDHIFPGIAIDGTGRVYVAWAGDTGSSSTNRIQISHMTTAGDPSSWSAPTYVDTGVDHANMFPWLVAGGDGIVDVAWYGGSLTGSGTSCPSGRSGTPNDSNGVNNNCFLDWRTKFAQSTDQGQTFTVSDASDVIHTGSVCDQGTTCNTNGGDRTLLDFFDMDLDSAGGANIAYASDVSSPGTATVFYTRQCTGVAATTGAALSRSCASLDPTSSTPAGPDGVTDGTNLITDPAGDATNPVGAGGTAPVDITNVSFATGTTTTVPAGPALVVTMKVSGLSQVPPPGTTDQYWYVTWTAPKQPDGSQPQYAVTVGQPSAAPAFQFGTFDPTSNQMTGTPSTVTGSFDTANNTITWTVPTSLFGSPSFAVASDPSQAQVQHPYAVTILGEGSADAGGLVFTQPADRAPNTGSAPAWPSQPSATTQPSSSSSPTLTDAPTPTASPTPTQSATPTQAAAPATSAQSPSPSSTPTSPTPTPTPTTAAGGGSVAAPADTTPPAAKLAAPTAAVTLGKSFAVRWSGSDSGTGVASYDVRYTRTAWNGRTSAPIMWRSRTTVTSARFTGTAGYEYCFSARSRDAAGNVSGWTRARCTTLPLDDRSLSASSGWTKLAAKGFYLGTARDARRAGRTLTLKHVGAGRVTLVVTTGRGFGSLRVIYGGKAVRTVSLSSSTTHNRVLITLPRLSRSATIVLKTMSSARVRVDGLAIARV